MVKYLAPFIVFGLAYSAYSDPAAAQEASVVDTNIGSFPMETGQDRTQNSPFISPGTLLDHGPYPYNRIPGADGLYSGFTPRAPLIVLPVPLPVSGIPGFNNGQGFQYPGSYFPAGTPLHRFNGYVVCDPPKVAAGQRIVKSTSTRSLSAPSPPQPCPVYTIDGEIPRPKSYTTTATPSIRNAAGDRQ
jgi:hypothetical protein